MRKRLARFVVTLRDAGFVIGQAEAQDAARLMSSPMAERPNACAPRCELCSLHAGRSLRGSTNCSTRFGAGVA